MRASGSQGWARYSCAGPGCITTAMSHGVRSNSSPSRSRNPSSSSSTAAASSACSLSWRAAKDSDSVSAQGTRLLCHARPGKWLAHHRVPGHEAGHRTAQRLAVVRVGIAGTWGRVGLRRRQVVDLDELHGLVGVEDAAVLALGRAEAHRTLGDVEVVVLDVATVAEALDVRVIDLGGGQHPKLAGAVAARG